MIEGMIEVAMIEDMILGAMEVENLTTEAIRIDKEIGMITMIETIRDLKDKATTRIMIEVIDKFWINCYQSYDYLKKKYFFKIFTFNWDYFI